MNNNASNVRVALGCLGASGIDRRLDDARRLFTVSALQTLDKDSAVCCQALLGHGNQFGFWETPEWMTGRKLYDSIACLNMRDRLLAYLPKDTPHSALLDSLLEKAMLWMTRYALLLRLGPASMGSRSNTPSLDATTIIFRMYQVFPHMLALGIPRRLALADNVDAGFLSCLTSDDINRLNQSHEKIVRFDIEFRRITRFVEMGLWKDDVPKSGSKKTTSPKGEVQKPRPEHIPGTWQPIPDDYLAAMGPRVLWFALDLGPNILHLAESIPELFRGISFSTTRENRPNATSLGNHQKTVGNRLKRYFEQHVWRDRNGKAIDAPPFEFRIHSRQKPGFAKQTKDLREWPPRAWTWENVRALITSLQAAHLWITLLSMAGRISEVSTLKRNCVEWARDGQPHINGMTYKLSANLAGVEREWPAPDVLVDALGQQARLVSAWSEIERVMGGAAEKNEKTQHNANYNLWGSIGTNGYGADDQLTKFTDALQILAERIGLSPKPGGINLHPHRFRKTVARLAALAIVDNPRVLMQLLGHKDIAMTLHYILTDKDLQAEIDKVARELRIMRCQELVEDMHSALHNPAAPKFGGHGGGGAPGMLEAVRTHEKELNLSGRQWGADSAYDLSVLLTNNGQFFRQTRPGVICIKEAKEVGPCTCNSTCLNRIEDKSARRDVREVIPILISSGQRAVAESRFLLAADTVQQLDQEIMRFDDIKEEFDSHPDVIALREAVA